MSTPQRQLLLTAAAFSSRALAATTAARLQSAQAAWTCPACGVIIVSPSSGCVVGLMCMLVSLTA